ncbi:MAG TPA: dihydroneopterin aldolase [Ferruginibacter sp.]|nr:dihydroneopterin aldolase [Ferruginibacter sp.]HMP20058.1 dihydroneopterin aldolase [Ferruginibacter sp.]
MFTIHLHQLRFFAHHGLYEQEKTKGNNFEVDADVQFEVHGAVTMLQQTVDYVLLYQVIQQRMLRATPLLETVAQEMADLLHQADDRINQVTIRIKKEHPPIPGFSGSVAVSFSKSY